MLAKFSWGPVAEKSRPASEADHQACQRERAGGLCSIPGRPLPRRYFSRTLWLMENWILQVTHGIYVYRLTVFRGVLSDNLRSSCPWFLDLPVIQRASMM